MNLNSILIIAQELHTYSALSLALQRCRYFVGAAANAKEALECLKTQQYHLVILDLKLSDMDGMCLVLMIRRLYPDLPILILTDNDSSTNIIKALRLGAQGYLLKPVSQEQIMTCVDEIFKEQWQANLRNTRQNLAKVRPVKENRSRFGALDEIDYFSDN